MLPDGKENNYSLFYDLIYILLHNLLHGTFARHLYGRYTTMIRECQEIIKHYLCCVLRVSVNPKTMAMLIHLYCNVIIRSKCLQLKNLMHFSKNIYLHEIPGYETTCKQTCFKNGLSELNYCFTEYIYIYKKDMSYCPIALLAMLEKFGSLLKL